MSGKIVIIESDAKLNSSLQDELVERDFEVEIFTDGKKAMAGTKKGGMDLVLLSMDIGGLNPFSLSNSFKRNPKLKDKPVILMASKNVPNMVKKANAQGMITKPFDMDVLIAELNQFIQVGDAGVQVIEEEEEGEGIELTENDAEVIILDGDEDAQESGIDVSDYRDTEEDGVPEEEDLDEEEEISLENSEIVAQNQDLKRKIRSTNVELDEFKNSLKIANMEREDLREQLSGITIERDELKTALTTTSKEREGLRQSGRSARMELEELKTSAKSVKIEKEDLKQSLSESNQTKDSLLKKKNSLSKKLSVIEEKLQEIQTKSHQEEKILSNQVKELEHKLGIERERLKQTDELYQTELDSIEDKNKKNLVERDNTINNLTDSLDKAQDERKEFEEKYQQSKDSLKKYEKTLVRASGLTEDLASILKI